MINKMKNFSLKNYSKIALYCAFSALLLAACKDNDAVTPGTKIEEKGIIPTKGQKYFYKVVEADGSVSNSVTQVLSVEDSAGMAVHSVENIIKSEDETTALLFKAYSKDGITTNELNFPSFLTDFIEQIKTVAYIDEFDVTGFPQYQLLENKGTVNSQITFKGDPIRIYMKLQVPQGEGQVLDAEIEMKLNYVAGKVIKEEDLTTPAGTFKCSKWQYQYKMQSKVSYPGVPAETTEETVTVNLWTAPGIGIVKLLESSVSGEVLTELQKIEK